MPVLLRQAGLTGAAATLTGESALTAELSKLVGGGIMEVGAAIIALALLVLIVFLRGLLVPLFLVVLSVLGLLATMGLVTWIFQTRLGYGGLVFYVPYAAGVLLLSFGADYNLYVVGRIWESASSMPLRWAIIRVGSSASLAVSTADVALAMSFATLALVGLVPFWETAAALFVGILLDTFVVRTLLVPSVLSLLGNRTRRPSTVLASHR